MKKYLVLFIAIAIAVSFSLGYVVGKPKHPLRISVAAVQEITMGCAGNYRDLAANRQYVYANCVREDGSNKPITIQNYRMK